MLTKFKENQRVERWKDTPFRDILAVEWEKPTAVDSLGPINAVLPEDAVILTIYNGVVSERWINEKQLPDSLLVRFENNTLDIRLVKGATLDRPVVIHHIAEATSPIHVESKISIHAEENTHASFLLLESGEGHYLATPEIDLEIKDHADIEWVRVVLNSDESFSVMELNCDQAESSKFHAVSYQSRGKIIRSNIRMDVNGEEAYTQLDALNIAKEEQHLAHVVDMSHAKPECESNQQIKNIVKDKAMTLFDGEIHVHVDSQKINADQMTRTLLLNDGARTLTIPRLEIYADDVQCTHGATVGFMDHDHMFYLRTRGLSDDAARMLLMRAYGAEIVASIENGSIQEWLFHILDNDIEALL